MKTLIQILLNKNLRESLNRLVMEKHLGRKLFSTELINHTDEDPSNNDIANLELINRSEHVRLHATGR